MRVSLSVASSGANAVAEIARLTALQSTIATRLATVAADVGTEAILDRAAQIRGSLTMSNNAKGRTLDALPIVRGGTSHAEAEIQAVPKGAWHLVEYGAAPHVIRPKKRRAKKAGAPAAKRGGKRRKNRALEVPGRGVFAEVDHPGTKPTGTWDRAMVGAEDRIDQAVQDEFDAAVTGGR